jgi:hypothetical protein
MTRLILTGQSIPEFTKSGFADLVVSFSSRFVWGPLPSVEELANYLGPCTPDHGRGTHWSAFAIRWSRSKNKGYRDLALAEFCQQYQTVELWFDMEPYAQLQLIWLLDYFRSHPRVLARLKLRLVDIELYLLEGKLAKWQPPAVDVTERELATASGAWQAYRAGTPEACFELLRRDLSALPLLRPALTELLEELPSGSTGLGATEMRMLEMIARGYSRTNALFHLRSVRQTSVFWEAEHIHLLDGLALGPRPAVAGFDDELRTLGRDDPWPRLPAWQRSELSLTEFGKAIVAHKEDFSRHNPIDRWWGGTHLTNDRLWRWNPVLVNSAGGERDGTSDIDNQCQRRRRPH